MVQNLLNKYFFYLYVFTLCFGVLLYNTTGFKGLDMVSCVLLIVVYIIYLIGTKNFNFNTGFLVTILVFLFFLNYSFYISDNTRNAIAYDFLLQLRPYVTFFVVLHMAPTFSAAQKSLLKKICFYIWLFFIPLGLYAMINPSFLSAMMDQPSNYTACITCLSIVYLFCSDFSMKDKLTAIFMLAVGLIVVHSQFYVFFLLACGILMYFHHADVLRNNLRTGLALATVAGLITYISRYEILNYIFPAGITGSGFASLAIQASEFYNHFNDLGFYSINGLISQEWAAFSGSFYPVLAQLGVIGIVLYLTFWAYIVVISIIRFRQSGDIQPFIITMILATFIFIENITDSFFTSNKGYFMMMFIGILLGKPENNEELLANSINTDKKKKKKKKSSDRKLLLFGKKVQPVDEITYLTPPIPARKPEPVVENTEIPAVNEMMPVNESIELAVSEEYNDVVTNTVNESFSESLPVVATDQISASTMQPAALFIEDEDDFEWEDDFEDEDIWEDDYIEEHVAALAAEQSVMEEITEAATPELLVAEAEIYEEEIFDDDILDEEIFEEEVELVAQPSIEEVEMVAAPATEVEIEMVAQPSIEEIELVAAPATEVEIEMVAQPSIEANELITAPAEEEIEMVAQPSIEEVELVAAPTEEEIELVAQPTIEEFNYFASHVEDNVVYAVQPVEEEVKLIAQPIVYSFSQPFEFVPKKAEYDIEDYENEDYAEDSFNYMI